MDYFPTREKLMRGLNAWMETKSIRDIKNVLYPKFSKKCSEMGIKPVKYEQLVKILGGTTQDLKYAQTVALLEAVEIDHWPKFLDLCQPPSIDDVVPIGPSNCEMRTVSSVTSPVTAIQVYCASPDTLNRIRTRIDLVRMLRGQSTKFEPHYGHEYVHVIEGRIECRFSEGLLSKAVVFRLVGSEERNRNKGDFFAVAFAAGLYHSFKCLSDVLMAVGRSAKSLPKGIK